MIKKLTLALVLFLTLSAFTFNYFSWKNDPPHSQLTFTVSHLGIADVTGYFTDFDVSVKSEKPDFSDATFEMTAKSASIDTRVEARNNHLKSADFFDVDKYPTLHFVSTGLTSNTDKSFTLTGDLTIHGVTKPVTMKLLYTGTVENPMSKKQTAGFQLTGKIHRSDFNVGPGFPDAMISDEVRIKADGEFVQN